MTDEANTLLVQGTDGAGNTSPVTGAVTLGHLPQVTITAPANLSYGNISLGA